MLMATTGDGWLVPLLITQQDDTGSRISAGPLPDLSEEQPVQFACWYGSSDPSSGLVNTGGTGMSRHAALLLAAMCCKAACDQGVCHVSDWLRKHHAPECGIALLCTKDMANTNPATAAATAAATAVKQTSLPVQTACTTGGVPR